VSMREDNGIEVSDRNRKRLILFCRFTSSSLKHSAIQGDGPAIDVQQVARARNLTGRTYECDFQLCLALGGCASREKDRQALFILRHQSRLPTAAAPLIEKVGQCILILTCVSRELDHDSLVFFHAERRRRYVSAGIVSSGGNYNVVHKSETHI